MIKMKIPVQKYIQLAVNSVKECHILLKFTKINADMYMHMIIGRAAALKQRKEIPTQNPGYILCNIKIRLLIKIFKRFLKNL